MSSPSGSGLNNPFLEDQGATPGPSHDLAGSVDDATDQFVAEFAKSYHASHGDAGQQQSAQFQGPAAVPTPYAPLTSVGKSFGHDPAVGLSPLFRRFVAKEVMPWLHLTHGSGSVNCNVQSAKWKEMALRSELLAAAIFDFKQKPNDFVTAYHNVMVYNQPSTQLFVDIAKQDTRFHLDLVGLMFAAKNDISIIDTDSDDERNTLKDTGLATIEQGRCILKAEFQPEGSPWKQQLLSVMDPNSPQFHGFEEASASELQQPAGDGFPATCNEFIAKLTKYYVEYLPHFIKLTGQMQHLILMNSNGDEGLDTAFFMELYLLAVSREDPEQKDAWLGMAIEADKILQRFENDHLHHVYTELLKLSPHLASMAVPLQNWRVEQAQIHGVVVSGSKGAPIEI